MEGQYGERTRWARRSQTISLTSGAEKERDRARAHERASEHSNRAPLTTARFMPLSVGGINALLLVFHATRTLLNGVYARLYGVSVEFLWETDDLKPMSGPWPQEESLKGVAISLVLTTCNSNAK